MVDLIASVCDHIRRSMQLDAVVLSGGVFMNALLSSEANTRLSGDGFRVYRHRLVPPNDGGISLGQLAIAAASGSRGKCRRKGRGGQGSRPAAINKDRHERPPLPESAIPGGSKQSRQPRTRDVREEKTMCLGIPGKVTSTYREHDVLMGKVDFGGVFKRVCLEHVPEAQVGEYVIVHVGFALSRIDEAEAKQVFAVSRRDERTR